MIDLYFWPTPNGYKPLIFCEETGIDYQIKPVNIGDGDQFDPEFLKISPNNKMPSMVDHDPIQGGGPQSVFESGAMLIYMADKTEKLLLQGRDRYDVLQWVFWQVGSLGPMKGQAHHFWNHIDQDVEYAKKRYRDETLRLIKVLEGQLKDRDYICGNAYTIADIMSFPWLKSVEGLDIDMKDYTNVSNWIERINQRDAVHRAYDIGEAVGEGKEMTEEGRKLLFGT